MAKRKKRRRRRGKRTSQLMNRAKVAGWTALYAYLKEQSDWGKVNLAKVPYVEAIGFDATMMLISHYAAKHGPPMTRKALDALATGLAGKVGYAFGANGFRIQGMSGGVFGESLSGEVIPDDFAGLEDE